MGYWLMRGIGDWRGVNYYVIKKFHTWLNVELNMNIFISINLVYIGLLTIYYNCSILELFYRLEPSQKTDISKHCKVKVI